MSAGDAALRATGRLLEREYQESTKVILDRIYREVEIQWHPFLGVGRDMYAPRIDIAVGPFAIERRRFEERYTELLLETKPFIESLIECHNQNLDATEQRASFDTIGFFNLNARCLLCIEIEDSGSRKHCLGNLVNASSLGRIGLLIARSEEILRTFVRQRVYLRFLADVEKNSFRTDNALVLSAEQFDECLRQV
jgi:hypothetical protein